jgi:hypothetical protein
VGGEARAIEIRQSDRYDTSVDEWEADDVDQLTVPKEEARLSTRFSSCSAQKTPKSSG